MKRSVPYLALAIGIVGCKGSTAPSTDSTTKQTVAKEQSSTSYKTPRATAPAAATQPPVVPAILKTAAFDYYGLSNFQPMSMQMEGGPQGTTKGTRQRTLVKLTNESMVVQEVYTDDLHILGPSQIEVRPDGVYTISAYGHTLAKPSLELPADPKPGTSWHVDNKVTAEGRSFEEVGDLTVKGIEKVQAGGKTYDALLVKEQGKLITGKQQIPVSSQKWYVKGLGEVKDAEQTSSGGTQNIVVEVTG